MINYSKFGISKNDTAKSKIKKGQVDESLHCLVLTGAPMLNSKGLHYI